MELAPVTTEVLGTLIRGLAHPKTRGGSVATLLLVLPRIADGAAEAALLGGAVPVLAALLEDGAAPEDPTIQANAAAVLGAVASFSDALHATVDAEAAEPLARLMRACGAAASAASGSGDAGGAADGGAGLAGGEEGSGAGGGDALSINVLSAVAQLAREPGRMHDAALSQEGLAALLACAGPQRPPAVAEAALDALCATASAADAAGRAALRAAGAVPAAAAVVAASGEAEALVRALMLLGMLAGSSAEARAELVGAAEGRAVVRLMGLAAQQSADADCRAVARDLLGLLTREPELRAGVEAAVRRAAAGVAAAAAAGARGGSAA
ncbi:hypothetical protein Rsub_05450 [Raphidocelis subcapitata]|uniref:Uncharacterized protein n=1 Tax=Raphidocelis subcapitata TaxID=307507 RepID=A0A2V0NYW8_9CHLO|nr:hypothetical protein Rsub_05450 [Raphidocelis subcapitata]|eukprot:GBF92831.1 hypothetical protein Rsub_05450 [Raphidocelis subcapitata]